jgi:predicted DNA binding protein
MGVTVRFTVPGERLVLGQLLGADTAARAEFEPLVPTDDGHTPLIWVHSQAQATVRDRFAAHEAVDSSQQCKQDGDAVLYRVAYTPLDDGILACLDSADGLVLRATGNAARWQFVVHCEAEADVSALHAACQQGNVRLQLQSISQDHIAVDLGDRLSEQQHEVLQLAFEEGYFAVPRETTLLELADQVGISDQAVSARLRRGLQILLAEQFVERAAPEDRTDSATEAPPLQ